MTQDPSAIPGYDYGTGRVSRSPVTLEELAQLKNAAGLSEQDHHSLLLAGEVLADQAEDMVSAWRARIVEIAWFLVCSRSIRLVLCIRTKHKTPATAECERTRHDILLPDRGTPAEPASSPCRRSYLTFALVSSRCLPKL